MNLDKFKLLLEGIFHRTESTFNKKRSEYAHDIDVFKSLDSALSKFSSSIFEKSTFSLLIDFVLMASLILFNGFVKLFITFSSYINGFL